MSYSETAIESLYHFYADQLLNHTVPFWFPKSFDKECGGFLLMRDHDGSLIDDDKAVWIQGRATWLLATLYNTVEKKQEWLEGAKLGYDFLNEHCFDVDGRMFFHVTRDGSPIRKRRYFFSETFYVIAAAAYAKASGDSDAADKARTMFGKCLEYATIPGLLEPKFEATRPAKGIGIPMIMMNSAQQLRETIGDPRCDEWISKWISEIETDFVKHDIRCVMEQVSPDGSVIDHVDGRTLNPGHAIEGAWFILHEAIYRNNDPHLITLGCKMLDYMWERGWDKEQGGILYFRDVYNKPVQEYWQDMKFWWPHNETIIATLLAFIITGNDKYAQWHQQVHDYAYAHFHDKKNGEWFGYLHRDGSIAQSAKGNLFKGPFHLPRQEWYCMQLLKTHLKIVGVKLTAILLLLPLCAFCQLHPAKIFTSNMVLQRDMPVHIYGTAGVSQKITITFATSTRSAITSADGKWSVSFARQPANANPQSIVIKSNHETIQLNNILIGDLWLCIGQSNMEFPLKQETHYAEELQHTNQPLLRLYNPEFIGKNFFGRPFTDSMKERLDSGQLYNGQWQECDSTSVSTMSAIGYYFGKKIIESENIPVGLIHLAIGGCALETFMSRDLLTNDKELAAKVRGNWLNNNALPVWVRQRGMENTGKQVVVHANATGPNHPFKPGFAYAAGIEPLLALPIKGVLLYQGESNSQEIARVNEYAGMMKKMIADYRAKWNRPTMPFYWMQLSSIDTAGYASQLWPQFRDAQRQVLNETLNVGMAVCSDLGLKNNVHPTNKKAPAERLARWALNKTYHRNMIPSGPLPLQAVYKDGQVTVSFQYSKGLRTSDGQSLRGFSMDGINEVNAVIKNDQVVIVAASKPGNLYFGWKPFTDANLVNVDRLPASTFKITIQ